MRRAMTCVSCEPKSRTAMVCGMSAWEKGKQKPDRGATASAIAWGAHDGGARLVPAANRRRAPWRLEFQAGVFVSALWTAAELGAGGRGVKRVATDPGKRRLAPLGLKVPVIAAVIPQPQADKCRRDDETEENDCRGEIDHGRQKLAGLSC